MAETTIASRNEFERWLKGKPLEVAAVLALRIALRVMPLIGQEFEATRKPPDRIGAGLILPIFRVITVAQVLCGAKDKDYTASIGAEMADSADELSRSAFVSAARSAATAATGAAYSAGAYMRGNSAAVISLAGVAADAASLAVGIRTFNIWNEIVADIRFLEAKGTIEALLIQPLWLEGRPEWAIAAWDGLKTRLHALGDHWRVWTGWYNALLVGRPPWGLPRETAEKVMGEAVLWPNDEWEVGPEHINPRIAELIREAGGMVGDERQGSIPPQDPSATVFKAGRSGPVRLAARQPSDGLTDTPEQRQWHAEVRQKVKTLREFGSNELGRPLDSNLDRFTRTLGRNIVAGRWVSLWSEGNSLRCKLSAHDKAPKDEFDPARLKHDVAESLRDLVETYNQLVLGDEKLAARDQQRPGPQDRKTLEAQAKAGDLIVRIAVGREGVADSEVKATLTAGQEAAKTATPDIHGDQALDQTGRQQRNFVLAWLKAARDRIWGEAKQATRKTADSMYSEAGKAAIEAAKENAGPMITAIAENAAGLLNYIQTAFTNPDTIRALQRIVESILGG